MGIVRNGNAGRARYVLVWQGKDLQMWLVGGLARPGKYWQAWLGKTWYGEVRIGNEGRRGGERPGVGGHGNAGRERYVRV